MILFLASAITTYFTLPFIYSLLKGANILRKNYKGDSIPVGMGIALIPVLILNSTIILSYKDRSSEIVLVFLLGNLTMAFIGIIDDLIGNRDTLGIKGHMGALARGRLTTGGLKAVMGIMIALFISILLSTNVVDLLVNLLIIALMTNLINLLDLRPGRGIKAFFTISIIFLIIGLTKESEELLFIMLGYLIIYFPKDLKGKYMMGDVGSNTLGVNLGIIAAISFSTFTKVIIVSILIFIHLFAERYSITDVIKKIKILNFIDELGR
ncbi:MraY family glycosyltransferase [Alkaliphilus peptidifermentans]|uniref:UDP-N-acetylmuramyl pentapeptide phosphotransferase/UDP-N-acetylglucosamine-1-phosphate transferase n=1 Tax=Alkaliphilus peptidifermentans DSM 18978 TaxID=1120976 RepID=A0A1G5KEB8_9FIRM|nr:glycosyltransferase [Alkaliphilus peptidifermentans]SCY98926.1 UDP-N-acetylmuramyl pentapeptide phosphotransferase/UDP-N-acetylglucosamine-1-phosphate transferase [Alkaliphilus peptidifermentans DSM 18978]